MNRRSSIFNVWVTAAMIGAAGIAGCEKKSADEPAATPADAKAVEARLAKADAVDGKVDKVVSKCAGCALGMDGRQEHVATTSGYTLRFCSEGCKSDFEKDASKAVMAMQIPNE